MNVPGYFPNDANQMNASTYPYPFPSADPEDNPPLSRLFVHCPATTSQTDLQTRFQQFGRVQSIRQLRDRESNQPRGLYYIKFDNAPSAAAALESLNGTCFTTDSKPVKVQFADPKGAPKGSAQTDGEVPPYSRLYVTYLKTMGEEEVKRRFAAYGELESFKVVKERETGEPRGIVYVKYCKTSSAIAALEGISNEEHVNPTPGQPIRVKIAQAQRQVHSTASLPTFPPPPPNGSTSTFTATLPFTYPAGYTASSTALLQASAIYSTSQHAENLMWKNPNLGKDRVDNNVPPNSRLFISFSKFLPVGFLQKLLSTYGELESVHILQGRTCGFAKFRTAEAAQNAAQLLNGMEIAPNIVARVVVADPQREGIVKHEY